MKVESIIFVLGFFLSMCGHLEAQIITDRPDQTESSSTVGMMNLQLESGLLLGFAGGAQNSSRQILAPTNLFRYGISKNIEIRFLSQFESQRIDKVDYQGISDLEIGTKIQLLKKEGVNTEIAFLSHLIIPSGTKELTSEKFGTINKLSISHVINDDVGIGYNIGYNNFGQDEGDLTYSIALGVGVNDRVGIYIEPYGDLANFEEHVMNFDAGFTYLANENLQFDFSFGTGITQRMNYISIGFSWLVERAKG